MTLTTPPPVHTTEALEELVDEIRKDPQLFRAITQDALALSREFDFAPSYLTDLNRIDAIARRVERDWIDGLL